MRRKREPSADELALWRRAMRGTAPLSERAAETPPEDEPAAAPPGARAMPATAPAPASARRAAALQPLDPLRPVDLDRRSWLRVRRGLLPVEARLDLHGASQDEAHLRLGAFLAAAQGAQRRCVLVITGRGLRSGGVLRAMVPRWLAEPPNRARVLTYAEAQPRHGGAGALYVLLKRRA